MRSVLLTVVALIVGLLIGYFILATTFGAGAGIGIATGLQAGACLTVEAAKEQGLITEEQVPEVLAAAARGLSAEIQVDAADLAQSAERCREILAEMRAAQAEAGN